MRQGGNSRVSLWLARRVVGCGRANESLLCCFLSFRLASVVDGFPFFERNCSIVVVHRRPDLVNCDDCCICIVRRSRCRLVQVRGKSAVLDLAYSTLAVAGRGKLLATTD
jgi:hypothetical protein